MAPLPQQRAAIYERSARAPAVQRNPVASHTARLPSRVTAPHGRATVAAELYACVTRAHAVAERTAKCTSSRLPSHNKFSKFDESVAVLTTTAAQARIRLRGFSRNEGRVPRRVSGIERTQQF